jgi:hypothetical protein
MDMNPALLEMPDELMSEILVRVPVKSLLRFRSVCKTWHSTISSRSFIGTHLQRSMSDHQRRPSFLITPDFRTKGANKIRLYKWQKGEDTASLVYTLNFLGASAPVQVLLQALSFIYTCLDIAMDSC